MGALLRADASDYSHRMVAAMEPAPGEEAAWIRRAQRGDAGAFESLYRAHVDKVYGLCLRMTGNVSEAEDCTQEAFIQGWNKLGKFRGDSAFSTWMHRIAVNAVLGRMRKNGFLTDEEYQAALEKPLVFRVRDWNERRAAAAFFVEEVRRYLVDRYGEDRVLTGGLTVKTTLDTPRQLNAYRSVRQGLRDHDRRQGYRGPIRNVPEAEWESTLAAIAETNAEVGAGEEELFRALVTP